MRNIALALLFLGLLLLANHHAASQSERAHQSLERQYRFCTHHHGPGPALRRCLADENWRKK